MPLVPPTVEQFATYIGDPDMTESGYADALATAIALVDQFVTSAFREVPQAVYSNEVLRTGHSVWKQSESVGGTNQQVMDFGQIPVRAPRDPMTGSYPVLRKYVLPF